MTAPAELPARRTPWWRRAALLTCMIIAALLMLPGMAAAQPPAPAPPPGQPAPSQPAPPTQPNPLDPEFDPLDPAPFDPTVGRGTPDPFSGCAPAPSATGPVSGLAGSLDPGVLEPQDTPAEGPDPYGQYGYGGLTWSTYDLGCGGAIRDPGAAIDTMFGNMFLDLSKDLFAAQVAVQNLAEDPAASGAVNEAARSSGATLNDAVFSPWSGAALVVAGSMIMIMARKGDLGAIITRVVLILVAVGMSALSFGSGAQLSEELSGVVRTALNEVEDTVAQRAFPKSGVAGADYGMRNVIYRELLWQSWKEGMVGTSGNADLAWQMFEAQALTRDEWNRMENGSDQEQTAILREKGFRWKQLADNEARPTEVQNIQGRGDSRTAAGAVALFKLLPIAALQIFGSLIKYMMFIFLAFLPAAAPLVALVGIVKPDTPEKSVKVIGAVIVAGTVASVVTLLHTLLVLYITNEGINNWSMILLCWVSALVLYKFMKPLTSLGGILATIHGASRRASSSAGRTGRWVRSEYRYRHARQLAGRRHGQLLGVLGAALRRGGGEANDPTDPGGDGRGGGGGGGPRPDPRGGPSGGPGPGPQFPRPGSGPHPDTGGGPHRRGSDGGPTRDGDGSVVRLPDPMRPAPATARAGAPDQDLRVPGNRPAGEERPGVPAPVTAGGRVGRAGREASAGSLQPGETPGVETQSSPARPDVARPDLARSFPLPGHDGAELGSAAVALLPRTAHRPGLYRPTRPAAAEERRRQRRPSTRRESPDPSPAPDRGRRPELGDGRRW
ncbi:hypothetical protein K1T35_47900 (plasmid) [Pseudonocardia sp. DSM 110487]|uniref:hypothetical protein n=1 Tax=Pseudonocardia sp. DSM 110487 TaxID=2865833 RepID=UPI001C6A7599|nr:hypothetical protein [Pseudonocardia sp. DSM 110487]QYN41075.1 hypothetical protein K1T35_47900 [Pseudonocardia sp. DSM 110487]